MTYSVQLQGADRIRRLLESDRLLEKPVKNALKAVGQMGKAEAKARAPRGRTGGVQRNIGFRVSSKARWVAIRAYDPRMVRTPGHGVSNLSRFLEFSPKHHHKHWLMNSISAVMLRLSGVMNQAVDEIERMWSGR